MRDNDASADDQRHIQRFLLLVLVGAEPVTLDDVIVDAVVATQARGNHQPHQFFVFRWDRAFEIGVVINVVEAFYEIVVGAIDDLVQIGTDVDESAAR